LTSWTHTNGSLMPDLSAARRPRAPRISTDRRPVVHGGAGAVGPSAVGPGAVGAGVGAGGVGASAFLSPKGIFGAVKPNGMLLFVDCYCWCSAPVGVAHQ